jgi:hypothetical protein
MNRNIAGRFLTRRSIGATDGCGSRCQRSRTGDLSVSRPSGVFSLPYKRLKLVRVQFSSTSRVRSVESFLLVIFAQLLSSNQEAIPRPRNFPKGLGHFAPSEVIISALVQRLFEGRFPRIAGHLRRWPHSDSGVVRTVEKTIPISSRNAEVSEKVGWTPGRRAFRTRKRAEGSRWDRLGRQIVLGGLDWGQTGASNRRRAKN